MALKRIISELIVRGSGWSFPSRPQAIPTELRDLSMLKAQESIAILVPHPDDEVIGCYFLMEEIGEFVPIDLIYVSEMPDKVLAETRRRESLQATTGLAVNNRIWWSFPDEGLHAVRREIGERLSEIQSQYSLVLCPAPWDKTTDHVVIAEEALNMLPEAQLMWYRSTWFTFGLRDADFVALGSPQTKRSALRCFRSQENLALQNTVSVTALESKRCGLGTKASEGFRLATSGPLEQEPLNVLSIKDLWQKRGQL